jgi:hypothetical protein
MAVHRYKSWLAKERNHAKAATGNDGNAQDEQ